MPKRFYSYDCSCDPYPGTTSAPSCRSCGRKGDFVGWKMSMTEEMSAFIRVTGLPPYGPANRTPEAQAIKDRMVPCPTCERRGLIESSDGEDWAWCPMCKGNQFALDGEFDPDGLGAHNDPMNGVVPLAGTGRRPRPKDSPGLQAAVVFVLGTLVLAYLLNDLVPAGLTFLLLSGGLAP